MAQMFEKMMLVPEATKVMDVQKQLNKALRKTNTSDGDKVRKIQQLLMKYLHHFKNLRGRSLKPKYTSPQSIYQTDNDETNDPNNEPQQSGPTEQEVNNMVAAITRRPDIMDINMRGELVYRGLNIPGSNILDLMSGVGSDQELFEAGMREVQEAEQTPGSVADFDGFSFYNEWNPQYASTPRSSSPIAQQRPVTAVTEHETSRGSLSNKPRHKMSSVRLLPRPENYQDQNETISEDELPDPIPLRQSNPPMHATDPRNSAVKTKPKILKRRRQSQAGKQQKMKRDKFFASNRRINSAVKTTLLGKRHKTQPLPGPPKYRHLDPDQILDQKRSRDLFRKARAKRRVSKIVKKVQVSRKEQNARKERVAEIITNMRRTKLKRSAGEEVRRIGPKRKKSRTGQSEQEKTRIARKRAINIDIKRRGPAKKYKKQEETSDISESAALDKFATLLKKARTQRIVSDKRRSQTKKAK